MASSFAPQETHLYFYDSDGSDYPINDGYNFPGLDADLEDIQNSTLKYLNYTTDYVRHWGLDEGFRETYQNWRDAILKSFSVNPSQFRTKTVETKHVILITAFQADSDEVLGYIRFQYDKDGLCVGGLKIANFKATLPYRSLGTGATSKAGDIEQAGQHGEGMKLSALVFRRNNYNFRIESGGFKWNFIFKRGELACGLRRIPAKALHKLKHKEQGKPKKDTARPWEDVCVIIGAPGSSRTIYGMKVKADRLHVDRFRQMLKVTLDINTPTKMINTPHGDLIRDPIYQGNMYLRGLLLPNGGTSGKPYTYGYNFVDGSTTRDRDTLAGSGEESERIAAIWASAIQSDTSDDSDLLTEYTNLLLRSLNQKGDAILSSDENCLTKVIAKKLWNKMRTMNHSQLGRSAFYYSAVEGKDEVHIIEQSLNSNPVPLDLEMWKMLRKYDLCRTPGEELLRRFKYAKPVDTRAGSFAMHVDTMLRCLLHSSSATKDMKLVFVEGETLKIDAGYFGMTWRVHDKWLTYDGAHEHAYCEHLSSDNHNTFVCDHVVLQLWDIMIAQLKATGEHPDVAKKEAWLKGMARARLSQMPRAVQCGSTTKRGELHVTWESEDSHRNKHNRVRVVLHDDNCHDRVASLRQSSSSGQYLDEQDLKCACTMQFSEAVSDGVTFSNLDANKTYCPSVSQEISGAFIALSPAMARPLSEASSVALAAASKTTSIPVAVGISFPVTSTELQSCATDNGHMSEDSEEDDNVQADSHNRSVTGVLSPSRPHSPLTGDVNAQMGAARTSLSPVIDEIASASSEFSKSRFSASFLRNWNVACGNLGIDVPLRRNTNLVIFKEVIEDYITVMVMVQDELREGSKRFRARCSGRLSHYARIFDKAYQIGHDFKNHPATHKIARLNAMKLFLEESERHKVLRTDMGGQPESPSHPSDQPDSPIRLSCKRKAVDDLSAPVPIRRHVEASPRDNDKSVDQAVWATLFEIVGQVSIAHTARGHAHAYLDITRDMPPVSAEADQSTEEHCTLNVGESPPSEGEALAPDRESPAPEDEITYRY